MGRSFDKIDIIFMAIIGIYLLVLFVGIMWIILSNIEKKEIEKKGSSFLTTKKKQVVANVPKEEKPVEVKPLKQDEQASKPVKKATTKKAEGTTSKKKTNTAKKKSSTSNTKKTTTSKKATTTKKSTSATKKSTPKKKATATKKVTKKKPQN